MTIPKTAAGLAEIKQRMANGEHTDGDLAWCVAELARLAELATYARHVEGCNALFMGICLRDHRIEDGEKVLDLKRGQEYTLGPDHDGKRMLFSRYWTTVDSALFGGIEPLSVAVSVSAEKEISAALAEAIKAYGDERARNVWLASLPPRDVTK